MKAKKFKEYIKNNSIEIALVTGLVAVTAMLVFIILGFWLPEERSKNEAIAGVIYDGTDDSTTAGENAPQAAKETPEYAMVVAVFWSDAHIDTITVTSDHRLEYDSRNGTNYVRDCKRFHILTTAPIKILRTE